MAGLFGGVLFSGIGLIALGYGKRQSSMRTMGIGVALMACSYFISNPVVMYLVGAGLTAALFIFRD